MPTTLSTPGDANCDATIGAADVCSLVAVLEGIAPPLCTGSDADQNATLDANDLTATITTIFQEALVP